MEVERFAVNLDYAELHVKSCGERERFASYLYLLMTANITTGSTLAQHVIMSLRLMKSVTTNT